MKDKLMRLNEFSDNLLILKDNEDFLVNFSNETGYSILNILKREIYSSFHFLKKQIDEVEYFCNILESNKINEKKIKKIYCVLPGNAPLYALCAKVLAPCVLLDVDLTVIFPSRFKNSIKTIKDLFNKHLPEIKIIETEGRDVFLTKAIKDPSIDTFVVFASDNWIHNYIDEIKISNKKLLFEGPGNDPCVISDNYNHDSINEILKACLNNSGQSCSSIKRLYVKKSEYKKIREIIRVELDKILIDESKLINKIFSSTIKDKIEFQITEAKSNGAKIIYGNGRLKGNVFSPTIILTPNNTNLVLEENFYPIIPIITFNDFDELERLILASEYGLNCSLFGNEIPCEFVVKMKKSHKSIFMNSTVLSPQNQTEVMKLGGYKRSGFIIENGNKSQGAYYLKNLIY